MFKKNKDIIEYNMNTKSPSPPQHDFFFNKMIPNTITFKRRK